MRLEKTVNFGMTLMDELFVGLFGDERDFFMVTTWHTDETLEEVTEFAKFFHIDYIGNDQIQIIEV